MFTILDTSLWIIILSILPGGHYFICGLDGFTKSICRRSHQAFPKFFFDGYQSSLKWSFDKDIGRHSCYCLVDKRRKCLGFQKTAQKWQVSVILIGQK